MKCKTFQNRNQGNKTASPSVSFVLFPSDSYSPKHIRAFKSRINVGYICTLTNIKREYKFSLTLAHLHFAMGYCDCLSRKKKHRWSMSSMLEHIGPSTPHARRALRCQAESCTRSKASRLLTSLLNEASCGLLCEGTHSNQRLMSLSLSSRQGRIEIATGC